jgi:hypothetical protein
MQLNRLAKVLAVEETPWTARKLAREGTKEERNPCL